MIRKAVIVALTATALAIAGVGIASFTCRSSAQVITGDVHWWSLPGHSNYPIDYGASSVPGLYKPFVLGENGDEGLVDVHVYKARLCLRWFDDTLERWTQMELPPFSEGDGLWGFAAEFGTSGLVMPQNDRPIRPIHALTLTIPLWVPFLILATYPAIALIRDPVRRWRRRKRGLCIQCGYNLTGLTEARCPECGRAV